MKNSKEIDAFIKKCKDDWKVPALSVGITNKKQLVYSIELGKMNISKNTHVTTNTLYRIGSVTKSITAAAIGLLVQDNLLHWDDKVCSILPNFRFKNPLLSHELTIRDLVSNRTGLYSYDDLLFTVNDINNRNILNLLQNFEFEYPIRTKFTYNNYMYVVLGLIIKELTGKSWEHFITERIFIPLSMNNTQLANRLQNKDRLASPYFLHDQTKLLKYNSNVIKVMNPAGGLLSSIEDMTKWIRLFLNLNEPNALLYKEHISTLITPQIIISEDATKDLAFTAYAMGWHVLDYKKNRIIRHAGHVGGYSSDISAIPNNDLGVIVLCNLGSVPIGQIISMYVYDLLLDKDITPWNTRFLNAYQNNIKSKSNDAETFKYEHYSVNSAVGESTCFVGIYSHELYGTVSIMNKENASLYIMIKTKTYLLLQQKDNHYLFYDNLKNCYHLHFVINENTLVCGLDMQFSKKNIVRFSKVEAPIL